jgi:hypothetical protein
MGYFSEDSKKSSGRVMAFMAFVVGCLLALWVMGLITFVVLKQINTAPYVIDLPRLDNIIELIIVVFSGGGIVKIGQKIIEKAGRKERPEE